MKPEIGTVGPVMDSQTEQELAKCYLTLTSVAVESRHKFKVEYVATA